MTSQVQAIIDKLEEATITDHQAYRVASLLARATDRLEQAKEFIDLAELEALEGDIRP